ncbi:response regulator [Silvimonas iriomotensis]|uniref:Uncharacterized protein n=1 Tax=Silvimonas iriomotensis TaxID=449662 RepID=A0ABQ2PCL9_9NEIS|nr:response regulator [Silvimonas iriomotensis]GGP23277.1 hypothetical protein GCM10010970_32770 [Silvimonas iriomotensis]
MGRILIADASPQFRQALVQMVSLEGHHIVAQASDARTLFDQVSKERPDLVIIELTLPALGGVDGLRCICALCASARILMYTTQPARHFALRCAQAGASGYVSKFAGARALRLGVRTVLQGRRAFPEAPAVKVADSAARLDSLSGLDIAIMQMLAAGYSSVEISEQLATDRQNVNQCKHRLLEKFGLETLAGLIDLTQAHGLDLGSSLRCDNSNVSSMENLHLLRAMIESSPNAMFLRDREGRLALCNPRFMELYAAALADPDYAADEATWFDPALQAHVSAHYQMQMQTGRTTAVDTHVHLNGSLRSLHVWCNPVRNASGEIQGAIGGLIDFTDRAHGVPRLTGPAGSTQAQSPADSYTTFKNTTADTVVSGQTRVVNLVEASSRLYRTILELSELIRLGTSTPVPLPDQVVSLHGVVHHWQKAYRAAPWASTFDLRRVVVDEIWMDGTRLGQLLDKLAQVAAHPAHLTIVSQPQPQTTARITITAKAGLTTHTGGDIAVTLALIQALAHSLGGVLHMERTGHLAVTLAAAVARPAKVA